MMDFVYNKSKKYDDLELIYSQCSGPGGLKLAEFIAEKMKIKSGARLLDVGAYRGYQTCFLAKEYGVNIVGIDPWKDREDKRPMVEHVMENAAKWGVEDSIMVVQVGVPDTGLEPESFDYVYSTTALEMIRGFDGEQKYLDALKEIHRLLKPGGIFGLGEPMHLDIDVPDDLKPYVSEGKCSWEDCFATVSETVKAVKEAGFQIIEADYAPDAWSWWMEYVKHDPGCKEDPDDDPKTLEIDSGRWTSFGYVIARK